MVQLPDESCPTVALLASRSGQLVGPLSPLARLVPLNVMNDPVDPVAVGSVGPTACAVRLIGPARCVLCLRPHVTVVSGSHSMSCLTHCLAMVFCLMSPALRWPCWLAGRGS